MFTNFIKMVHVNFQFFPYGCMLEFHAHYMLKKYEHGIHKFWGFVMSSV